MVCTVLHFLTLSIKYRNAFECHRDTPQNNPCPDLTREPTFTFKYSSSKDNCYGQAKKRKVTAIPMIMAMAVSAPITPMDVSQQNTARNQKQCSLAKQTLIHDEKLSMHQPLSHRILPQKRAVMQSAIAAHQGMCSATCQPASPMHPKWLPRCAHEGPGSNSNQLPLTIGCSGQVRGQSRCGQRGALNHNMLGHIVWCCIQVEDFMGRCGHLLHDVSG